eukprot:72406_1
MSVHYSVENGIAVLELDSPPLNALGRRLTPAIKAAIDRANADPSALATVLIGRGRVFVAGADISEFAKTRTKNKNEGSKSPEKRRDPLDKIVIESPNKLLIAAIHGVALGGGLELSLMCHLRVGTSKCKLGLPEVKLGLIPGWFGTQYLPRVVGTEAAAKMIAYGEPISASEGLRLGLLDAVMPGDSDSPSKLRAFAVKFARERADAVRGTDVKALLPHSRTANKVPAAFFDKLTAELKRTRRGLQAPLAGVEAVRAASELPVEKGILREKELFASIFYSTEAKAQQYLFFAERAARRIPGINPKMALPIRRAGVIGAGTMGRGITISFLQKNIPVVLVDSDVVPLGRGLKQLRLLVRSAIKRGIFGQKSLRDVMELVEPTLDMEKLSNVDIVIEAVFENLEVKQKIFRQLDRICRKDALMCSNTSALDIDRIASVTSRPDKVIGVHFFAPANLMKLIENVRGAKSSKSTIATVMELSKNLGKIPVLVGNCRGFVGNRLFFTFMNSARALLEEGALPQEVDRALVEFGFAMGPFAVADLSGLDILSTISTTKPRRSANVRNTTAILNALVARGRLGQKSGSGFYDYATGSRKPKISDEVTALVREQARASGYAQSQWSKSDMVAHCVLALVNEGFRVLEEGIAIRPSDIDLVFINGYGFPRARGGPMFYADQVGLGRVLVQVEEFARANPRMPQWAPAPLLRAAAESGMKLGSFWEKWNRDRTSKM